MQISAAVLKGARQPFIIEDVELGTLRPDEVLVRLVATGICHSDMTLANQAGPFVLPFPIVLGHEGAGVIEAVGDDVSDLACGDHVVLTFASCGNCGPCSDRNPAYCSDFFPQNLTGARPDGSATMHDANGNVVHGAFMAQSSFATYSIANRSNTIKVRKDAPLELLGPIGCGLMTGAGTVFNVMKPKPGQTVAIMGAGAVGLAGLLAAKLCGVTRIIAVDRVAERLELAKELGASDVIDTSKSDLNDELAKVGPIDFALDATGVPAVLETVLGHLTPQGMLCLIGASSQPEMTVNIWNMMPGKIIRSIFEGDSDPHVMIPRLVDHFMEGTFPIDRLACFYDFKDINTAAQDGMSGKAIKPIIVF
jgi:aryl-alcohol dehydrogenase